MKKKNKKVDDLINEHLVYVEGVGWELECSDEVLDTILEDFFNDEEYGYDDEDLWEGTTMTKEEQEEELISLTMLATYSLSDGGCATSSEGPMVSKSERDKLGRGLVEDLLTIDDKTKQQECLKFYGGVLTKWATHQELKTIFS